jgi:hypothetical protein
MGLGWDVRKSKGVFGLFGGGGGDIDLDASCLLFDAGRSLVDQVWFRQLKSRDGSLLARRFAAKSLMSCWASERDSAAVRSSIRSTAALNS